MCSCICSKDAHVAELLIHGGVTHVFKMPVEAAQTSCKTHTHAYIKHRVCEILLQQDYASKPVSTSCGCLLIPSKEVCSGQLMLHVNIQVYRVEEAVAQSEVKSLCAWILVVVGRCFVVCLIAPWTLKAVQGEPI